MSAQKYRWSQVYESSEEELVRLLEAKDIPAKRFAVESDAEAQKHAVKSKSVIWCAEGSFKLDIGSRSLSMQPGDAVRFDADTTLTLTPGISGYVRYES